MGLYYTPEYIFNDLQLSGLFNHAEQIISKAWHIPLDSTTMAKNNYLYFRRVDKYSDDINDSSLPDKDRNLSQQSKFQYAPNISMADYYDGCRSKSYACCFTTKISKHVWKHYGSDNNSICLIFKSGKLIEYINTTLNNSRLIIKDHLYHDFFWINYGLVDYIDYNEQYLLKYLPNPTKYIYIKDLRYPLIFKLHFIQCFIGQNDNN